ncbi:RebB family R body protein [Vibrio sp. SCSIO 43132]|uniref:RebB family R body protein n=1 Tax=Vibrio sp. SCSIO 43132 TaxID=2779363 RepID=UPI001CA892F2|nr:RebB family R body protein [Vibrio sp. SCSIO 43132]UAB69972.1 RebB family R body protein [Vibrio sp. SCSIO 43132]
MPKPKDEVKVNEQITDSVTQTNTQVLASSPSNAMGNLYTSMGLAMSNLNNNATNAQQQANIGMQAATVQGVNALTAIGTAALSRATEEIVEKDSE